MDNENRTFFLTIKQSVIISLHIFLFTSLIFVAEHDRLNLSFLKFDRGVYVFGDGQLLIHGVLKNPGKSTKEGLILRPAFLRGVNDLLEGWGDFRIVDFDSSKLHLDASCGKHLEKYWGRNKWFWNPAGYISPLFPSPIKFRHEFPDNYWLNTNYYHAKETTITFVTHASNLNFSGDFITNDLKFQRAERPVEFEPTIPDTFYIYRILFILLFAAAFGDCLYLIYLLSGWILAKLEKLLFRKTLEPDVVQESKLANYWDKKWFQRTEIIFIFSIVFLLTFYYTYFHLDHVPRVVDEAGYLFQAKIFASGQLSVPMPEFREFLDFPGIALFKDVDKVYHRPGFPGHPLLLVPGTLIRATWLTPPLLLAFAFVFMFLTGRYLFSGLTAWLTVILGMTSPWIIVLGASFMPHTPALCFGAMFIYFYVRFLKERTYSMAALAGFAMGMEVLIRPFTAFCLAIAMTGASINRIVLKPRTWLKFVVFLLVIAAFMGLLYQYIQAQGVVCGLNETAMNESTVVIKWNTLKTSLFHFYKNLSELQLSLFGWPPYLTLSFFLIALLFCPLSDIKTGIGLLFFIISIFYSWKGHYGWTYEPRYWYEAVPALLLFTAAGIEYLGIALTRNLKKLRFLKYSCLLIPGLLVAINFCTCRHYNVINRSKTTGWYWQQFHRFNNYCYVNARLRDWVEANRPKNVIIFVGGGPPIWRMTPIMPLVDLDFQGDIIFAVDKGSKQNNQSLIDKFPDREVLWFNNNSVLPYSDYMPSKKKPKQTQKTTPVDTKKTKPKSKPKTSGQTSKPKDSGKTNKTKTGQKS